MAAEAVAVLAADCNCRSLCGFFHRGIFYCCALLIKT